MIEVHDTNPLHKIDFPLSSQMTEFSMIYPKLEVRPNLVKSYSEDIREGEFFPDMLL